jgi:hypothetical protein
MSVVQEVQKQSPYTTMPCGFEEEFVDFESAAHHYSISSCAGDEWGISELDDEALGIVDARPGSRGINSGSGGSKSPTSTTGRDVSTFCYCALCIVYLFFSAW